MTLNDLEVESTVVPELSEVEIQSEVLQHDDTWPVKAIDDSSLDRYKSVSR